MHCSLGLLSWLGAPMSTSAPASVPVPSPRKKAHRPHAACSCGGAMTRADKISALPAQNPCTVPSASYPCWERRCPHRLRRASLHHRHLQRGVVRTFRVPHTRVSTPASRMVRVLPPSNRRDKPARSGVNTKKAAGSPQPPSKQPSCTATGSQNSPQPITSGHSVWNIWPSGLSVRS